jgi:transcriptional regulator of acetoin/glycerol metabolism
MIMKTLILTTLSASLLASAVAFAQTSAPTTSPTNPVPPVIERSTMPPIATTPGSALEAPTLNEQQAKDWINKVVYSSENTNVGEVAAFARDATGKVTEMHADIGGFLGIGETRVRVMPAQFKLMGDRVMLNLNSEQVKSLPKIAK